MGTVHPGGKMVYVSVYVLLHRYKTTPTTSGPDGEIRSDRSKISMLHKPSTNGLCLCVVVRRKQGVKWQVKRSPLRHMGIWRCE